MTHEAFKNITAGAESIVTLVAIVVAGVWVLYTFWRLGALHKARAEIAALERSAVEEPVLQIDLQVLEPASQMPTARHDLSVSAKLRNDGQRTVIVTTPTLLLSRVADTGERAPVTPTQRLSASLLSDGSSLSEMPARVLRAGQARTVAFFASVPSPGHYMIQFEAIYFGAVLRDGEFHQSEDVPVHAIEQAIAAVS